MNRADVIRMATAAGILGNSSVCNYAEIEDLEEFAALVAAHEREKCAKACEELTASCFDAAYNEPYLWCAAAIRARGEA